MVHCPKCSNFEFMRTKVYYQLKKIKIKHVLYKQSGICLEEQTIMKQFQKNTLSTLRSIYRLEVKIGL